MVSIPIQLPLFSLDTKVCILCKTAVPIEQFYIHRKDTGERQSSCKACHCAKSAARYAANHDRKKETSAAWYVANRERARAYNAAWLVAHREQKDATNAAWLATHREQQRASIAAWSKKHPGRVSAHRIRRRQRIILNGGHYTGEEWEALKARYEYHCLMCGRQEPDIKLTFDHVVPVTKGGTNDIGNGQPLCFSCNSRKHTRVLDLR